MSVLQYIVQYAMLYKYQAFPFVPYAEKRRWFPKFVRLPFHQEQLREIVDSHFQMNKFQELVRFMRTLKSPVFMPLPSNKDYELIWGIVWNESIPELSGALLQTLLSFRPERSAFHVRIWNASINLLFSATCPQDTQVAITMLNIFGSQE